MLHLLRWVWPCGLHGCDVIPAVITLMVCTSVDRIPAFIEVPGMPISLPGYYVFPDLGVKFSKRHCYVDRIDRGEGDAPR